MSSNQCKLLILHFKESLESWLIFSCYASRIIGYCCHLFNVISISLPKVITFNGFHCNSKNKYCHLGAEWTSTSVPRTCWRSSCRRRSSSWERWRRASRVWSEPSPPSRDPWPPVRRRYSSGSRGRT